MTSAAFSPAGSDNWLEARRDPETGIESLRAHFSGHAYDPHDHDDMLVGYTEQGVQRFWCRRSLHTSVPGRAILIEPGALHDGHAPEAGGFTYAMLYLPQTWVERATRRLNVPGLQRVDAAFAHTLVDDSGLVDAIRQAFLAIYGNEGRLARDQTLDRLVRRLAGHLGDMPMTDGMAMSATIARVRDFLHDHMDGNVGLDELANIAGIDRFRLKVCSSRRSARRRTRIWSACACARRADCWQTAAHPRRLPRKSDLRIKAILAAGFAVRTG